MATISFQSFSLTYPPRISLGSLLTTENPEAIGNQVKMFCETLKGERVLLPDWGLPSIVHEKAASSNEIVSVILANLNRYFRGTQFTAEVKKETVLGMLEIEITYTSPKGYGTITVIL